MKRLILTSAISALALALSACGDNDADADDAAAGDTTVVETEAAPAATTADADWPAGSRIVEEGGKTYRVNPDDTRVEIPEGGYRIATVDGVRYRVDASGNGHRIDDEGVDLDLPAVEGLDIDLGTNKSGNLDLDVSTNGTDASNDRGDD
jgi:hypothetical protein